MTVQAELTTAYVADGKMSRNLMPQCSVATDSNLKFMMFNNLNNYR